jgi:hypothetical protein
MTPPARDHAARGAGDQRRLMPSQYLTLVAGVAFFALAVAGFFVTGFDGVFDHDTDDTLLGFGVNPMHNVVHLALGLLGVVLWRSVRGSLTFGLLTLAGYGAAFVFGLFAVGEDWNFLALNWAANWLHLALGILGAAIAALAAYELRELQNVPTAGARARRPDTDQDGEPTEALGSG